MLKMFKKSKQEGKEVNAKYPKKDETYVSPLEFQKSVVEKLNKKSHEKKGR